MFRKVAAILILLIGVLGLYFAKPIRPVHLLLFSSIPVFAWKLYRGN
jgi:hypothetical protein